jgi:hypothetical protein
MQKEYSLYGYTIDQVRQMDVWMKKQNLTWEIISEKVQQGIQMGMNLENARWQGALNEIMLNLNSNRKNK